MAKERGSNVGKDNGSVTEGVGVSTTKIKPNWKKRVKLEYGRLRLQRKNRLQEDIKGSWRKNKADKEKNLTASESGGPTAISTNEEDNEDKNTKSSTTKICSDIESCEIKAEHQTGKLVKPIWVCSEDPPLHSQFIRRAEAKDHEGKIQSIPIKIINYNHNFSRWSGLSRL